MSAPLKLYWHKVCPFVHRAWITAVEKNIAVELVHIPLDNMPDWYKAINPRETVPTLQHGEKLIFESSLIAQYLDDAFEPKQSLFPGTAFDRHRIRFFQEQVGEFIGAAYTFLMDCENAEARKETTENVANLEKILKEQSAGPFFLGNTFSLADISLVPFLDRFRFTLGAYANYDMFENAPRLKALLDAAFLRPSVFSTAQPASYYIESYKSYAKKEATLAKYTLYVGSFCPFCERVKLAAAAKGIELNFVSLDLGNIPEWYSKFVNPRGTVPALTLPSGAIVHESTLIAEFLDEDAPLSGPRLVPQDAATRYAIQFFLETAGGFYGEARKFLSSKGAEKEDFVSLSKAMHDLMVQQSAGPFFLGEEPSLADVALLPSLVRVVAALPQYAPDYKFFNEFPRFEKQMAAARAHPAMGKLFDTPETYVKVLQDRGHLPAL